MMVLRARAECHTIAWRTKDHTVRHDRRAETTPRRGPGRIVAHLATLYAKDAPGGRRTLVRCYGSDHAFAKHPATHDLRRACRPHARHGAGVRRRSGVSDQLARRP